MKIKRTYRFATKTSLYITLISSCLISLLLFQYFKFNWIFVSIYAIITYVISFFIIQFRVERFIYRRVKKIYDDLTLLESANLHKGHITTDMKTLTEKIDKFARDKKLEIETLKIREEYSKEFLGNVSHELKTPLFTVQGYLLTLLDGAINDKKVQTKYLKRANKGVERLIFIVKDLDMITKLEVGDLNLNIEIFNIIHLIKNTFELLEMKAAKKKIKLSFEKPYNKPILVKADKERIQQVLTNLIDNSIKYGESSGITEISVDDLIKDKVLIRVTDNGEGVEEEYIPRLFERFYRIDKSGSRKEGGSGLGLAIVKHIIEAHKEKLYVESELDVGSEFSFTLEKAK